MTANLTKMNFVIGVTILQIARDTVGAGKVVRHLADTRGLVTTIPRRLVRKMYNGI